MLDNLREDAASSQFDEEAKFRAAAGTTTAGRARSRRFLGMTAIQRFVLAFMLMLAVCTIGSLALLILGKVVL